MDVLTLLLCSITVLILKLLKQPLFFILLKQSSKKMFPLIQQFMNYFVS